MSARLTIIGRLGADPELTFAPSGVAVAKFRVVTDRRVKEGDEWVSKDTTWWSCTAFKALAEGICEELRKGDLIIAEGKVSSREYETREGEKRTVWEFTADHVGRDLMRPRKGATSAPSSAPATDDPWATPAPQGDMPF